MRPELRFDNANNTALSLRIIAEYARRGDIKVTPASIARVREPGEIVLHVHFNGPQAE